MRPPAPPSSRRDFLRGGLALAGAGLLAGCGVAPIPAPATPVPRIPQLGVLSPSGFESTSEAAALWDTLASLGYVRDQAIRPVIRYGQSPTALAAGAAELVGAGVDLIVATSTGAALAARQATGTVPIVMVEVGDPVGMGLAESLAHPGGNVTGTTNLSAELSGKRLEYLKQLVPAAARVAVVKRPSDPDAALALRQMEGAAPQLGLELVPVNANSDSDLADAFEAATGGRADAAAAILESGVPGLIFQRFAAARRLPTIYAHRSQVVPYRPDMPDWGLVAYAADRAALYRRAAAYVDRILKGARPADLPVEQPTKFDLVINLKTAQGLGLTIPPSVLQQASEVIQ